MRLPLCVRGLLSQIDPFLPAASYLFPIEAYLWTSELRPATGCATLLFHGMKVMVSRHRLSSVIGSRIRSFVWLGEPIRPGKRTRRPATERGKTIAYCARRL